jgi:hypothetical protein
MILRAYVDDSDINQEPVSILAGWIAPARSWASFADAWQLALDMKPRLRYFKMTECMGFGGEFSGWSKESRDQRLRYLIKLIEEHKLLGVGAAIRTSEYRKIFHNSPQKIFDVPYFLMIHGLMAGLVTPFTGIQEALTAKAEKVDFVFDDQPDQMEKVLLAWSHFKEVAPESVKALLGDPPIFRNDMTTLPLQAADLHAWSLRAKLTAEINGEKYVSPWGDAGDSINTATWAWTKGNLQITRAALDEASRLGRPAEIWPK